MNARAVTSIDSLHPQYITNENGERVSVILSIEVVQDLLADLADRHSPRNDTEYLLSNPANAERLKAAIAERRAGKGIKRSLIG